MIVTTKAKMDLLDRGMTSRIDAVQGDINTRALELQLYAKDEPFQIPDDVTARMRYCKPDGTGGVYDTLPDGTRGWAIQGNVISLILAPQVLAVPGLVRLQAELMQGAVRLTTFDIQIDVEADVAADVIRSEDYVNMEAWLLNALDASLEEAAQSGDFCPDIRMGAVTTMPAGSAAVAYFSGTGMEPLLNLGIPEGYTPQRGVDYWTEGDVADIQSAVEDALRPEILAKLQQTPCFADSTTDCTDTGKVYVLPDGYLYAYTATVHAAYTNLVPVSEAPDSTDVYNGGLGYREGYYISSASGNDSEKSGHVTTGMIPWAFSGGSVPAPIYLRGGSLSRLALYNADKSFAVTITSVITTQITIETLGTDYYKISPVKLDSGNAQIYETYGSIAYFRLDTECESGADLVVTVGEEISSGEITTWSWTNTGLAFTPADYEDRIIALETGVQNQEARILQLESGMDGTAFYIQEEAERVADLALEKRNAQCLCFAALSDIHYPYDDGTDDTTTGQALVHAAAAITEIRKVFPLDFVGLFGDYVKGGSNSTVAESKAALKFIRRTMYEAGLGARQIWMQGNHDRNPYDTDDGDLSEDELYSCIFAGNAGTVDGDNPQRGYGYQDFETQKIRVIYLNSSDISGAQTASNHMWSAAQLRWLADVALDLSAKDSPGDWGMVVLSYQPMNWGTVPAFTVIDAYASGSAGTAVATEGETVHFDFSARERGEILCCINGHTHNYRCARIGENGIWQIAVPQVCAGRYNEYAVSWPDVGGELDADGEPVYYYKKAGTAEGTSFCLFLIDRKNRKIHALHYGAGIDRELDY